LKISVPKKPCWNDRGCLLKDPEKQRLQPEASTGILPVGGCFINENFCP
jgi:hypothetical protein